MKKSAIIGLVSVIVLLLAGVVYAWGPGYGMGYGPGTNVENVKKFQKETLTLRDELTTKRLELQTEYSKPEANYDRIATLRKEIVDIQTKIQAIADKYGLHTGGSGRGMGQGMMGPGMMEGGMMGPGMMMMDMCPMMGW